MSVPNQGTVTLCRCDYQCSIDGRCQTCGGTISIQNVDQAGNSLSSENRPISQSESERADLIRPPISPNDSLQMDQSISSQHSDGKTDRVSPSGVSGSFVNITEGHSWTPTLTDNQSNFEDSNMHEDSPHPSRMTPNVNRSQLSDLTQHGNTRSPNVHNPNIVRPPFSQAHMPNPTMPQGFPQFYTPQGMSNFNQNNQYIPHWQPQTHADYNPPGWGPTSYDSNLSGQSHSPTGFNTYLQGRVQTLPGQPQTLPGQPHGLPGADPNETNPFNPMMNPGIISSSYSMPPMYSQGGQSFHTPDSMSQSAESSMNSSMYAQQPMLGGQMMMHPLLILLQKKVHLDQKVVGYQRIHEARGLTDSEKVDYDQILHHSAQLRQETSAIMQSGGLANPPYMLVQMAGEPLPREQMIGSQSQVFPSASDQPCSSTMLNSQMSSTSQSQQNQGQQRITPIKTEPSLVCHQTEVGSHLIKVKTEPTTSESNSTSSTSTSTQVDREDEQSQQTGTEIAASPPKIQKLEINDETESSDQLSDFTPPLSPRTLLSEGTGFGNENFEDDDDDFFEVDDTNRTEVKREVNDDQEYPAAVSESGMSNKLTESRFQHTPKSDVWHSKGESDKISLAQRMFGDAASGGFPGPGTSTSGKENSSTRDDDSKLLAPPDHGDDDEKGEASGQTAEQVHSSQPKMEVDPVQDRAQEATTSAQLSPLNEVHEELFNQACQLIETLNNFITNDKGKSRFKRTEQLKIQSAMVDMKKKRKACDDRFEQIKTDSSEQKSTDKENEKLKKKLADHQNTHLKFFSTWFKKLNEFYMLVSPEKSEELKWYYNYLDRINPPKNTRAGTGKGKTSSDRNKSKSSTRAENVPTKTKFVVYIANNFGEVRNVNIVFFRPYEIKARCQRRKDSRVWTVEVELPSLQSHHCHYYKYQFIDARGAHHWEHISSYNYASYGSVMTSRYPIRNRFAGQKELMSPVVYDGAALPEHRNKDDSAVVKAFKYVWSKVVSSEDWRGQEIWEGYHMMAPIDENLFMEKTSSEVCQTLQAVYQHFSRIHEKSPQFKQTVAGYIHRLHEWLKDYMNHEDRNWNILLSSLISLLWMWSYQRDAVDVKEIRALIEYTFNSLHLIPGFCEISLEQLSAALGKFNNEELLELIKAIAKEGYYKFNTEWFMLYPLLHAISMEELNRGLEKGCHAAIWWGELKFLDRFKNNLKASSLDLVNDGIRYQMWYKWLQPFFKMDLWAPRIFLAYLSAPAFTILMRDTHLLDVPMDALSACLAFHTPTDAGDSFWDNLTKSLLLGLTNLADKDEKIRMTMFRTTLASLHDALIKYGRSTSLRENRKAVLRTMLPYLTVLNEAISTFPNPEGEEKDFYELIWNETVECVHQFVQHYTSGMTLDRIKMWERLLECSSGLIKISEIWEKKIINLLKNELAKISKLSYHSSSIIDRYLDPNLNDKRISAVLLEYAIQNAQDLLKKDINLQGYRQKEQARKISQIVVHAVDQTWKGIDDERAAAIDIVTNVLKWKNFVTLYDFIKTQPAENLPEKTHILMNRAVTALHDVVNRLKSCHITINEVTTLQDHVADLVEACKCNDERLQQENGTSLNRYMATNKMLIQQYDTFRDTMKSLLYKCQANFSDDASDFMERVIHWVKRKENGTSIRSLFDEKEEVLYPELTPEFRQIANEWEKKKSLKIFSHYFNMELKTLKATCLQHVVDSYRNADVLREKLLTQIREGVITAARARKVKDRMFDGKLDLMTEELSASDVAKQRIKQIEICEEFETHRAGAKTIHSLRNALQLTGDFQVLNVFTSPLDDVRLNQIDQQIIDGAKILGRPIKREEIDCLTAISTHPDFVKWARNEVPDNEIRTFIDLAHNNIGENDDTARKIDALMDALNGYSPMIYEMKPETDFKKFMEIAGKVWAAAKVFAGFKSGDKRKKHASLPKQLGIAAAELELWKDLKENLNNFEIDVLSQAASINDTGVFRIGAINDANRQLKLNDIIELDCELKRRVVSKNDTNESEAAKYSAERFDSRTDSRFKSYKGSLEELQEKLTLIAGDKQRENEDTIDKFDKLRDVVTKLGQASLDLQREGCILFDDLLIIIHCSKAAEIPLELKFAGAGKPLRTMNHGPSVIQNANNLHKFMIECMIQWEAALDNARKKHRILNHYTTEQLVTLRRELAKLFRAAPGKYHEVLRLVRIVAPASENTLFQLGQKYRKESNETTVLMDTKHQEDEAVEELVEQIMESDDLVEQNQCVFAVKMLGTEKPINEYIDYIKNQMEVTSQDATISSEIFTSSEASNNMMDQLMRAWKQFLDMTSSTHKKLLSIDQLVSTLNALVQQDEMNIRNSNRNTIRKKPDWLESNKPTLLVCDKSKMLQLVLSVYMEDMEAETPTRSHILVCTKLTTVEEVKIFMLRALSDSASVYCMVNCERLDNSKCRVIEEQIYQSKDHRVDGYTICFFCDEAVRDARIRSYLSKFSVHNIDMIKHDTAEKCRAYIQTKILTAEHFQDSVRAGDNGLACRVIRSDQAGVGKTLHCTRIHEHNPTANYVIIPIYRKLDIDAIIRQLYERCKPEPASNIIHIDISYEVESGVDDILMNLIVLGSICSSKGAVWHRDERDYYLIESMPFKKVGNNVHHLLDLMPTIMCKPPTNQRNELTTDTSLDSKILATEEWQIALKFLERHEVGDGTYKLQPGKITNKTEAMRLIVKHCGLDRPSWSELTYFVNFLSSQLLKVETSPYCSPDNTSNPTGFRKFVVEFMRIMAQDFATRSLKISEETPGLTLNEAGDGYQDGGALEMLTMKRSWESANHPYLFFNEDSASFSFIGFVLTDGITDRECFIIDPETGCRIEKYPTFPRQLKNELERSYKVNLSQPFNRYSKEEKLNKMQQIMVKDPHLYRGKNDQITDPDPNYELTLDNVKKILAIHQRIRVGIPVIVMGDTGCGKTKLIDYASKLQVPEDLRKKDDGSKADLKRITNMITVKVHGGTTEEDIIHYVNEAQKVARENQQKCEAYARKRGWVEKNKNGEDVPYNIPSVYTVLFLDEANTTEAIGLVKEILCDGRMLGKPLDLSSGLKIIAACNPYRKHNERMIKKLREAGLGYFIDENETTDKFAGHIPMRHLVYRVQALSQSLLPLVWDFGTLKNDVERQYITQMITRAENRELDFGSKTNVVAQIISDTHAFMRKQEDECSFVSLRDVNRLLEITLWFQKISEHLIPLIEKKIREEDIHEHVDEDSDVESEEDEHDYLTRDVANSLLLAIGVCYLARLEEDTRKRYSQEISQCIQELLDSDDTEENLPDGAEYFNNLIRRCQDVIIDEVIREVTQEGLEERGGKAKHTNIAKNKALKENVFMMIVCIENRIPLFLVGKPGSSKSLSKAMVFDALVGRKARSQLIQKFKQTYMVSFQCSRLATPNSIVSVFHEGAKRQQNRDINDFVSIIVLDEVGLAEDSENMPLKALHPLLEDGCEGHEKPEPWKKCAFIGISNWALDPAKMNRGIFVQRGTPEDLELIDIARGICKGAEGNVLDEVDQVLQPLVNGYLAVCKAHKPSSRELTEFFGLRDFYSLVKMVLRFAQVTGRLYKSQIIHAIKRNFGGFDPRKVDCLKVFIEQFPELESWKESDRDRPPIKPMDLVKCSITNDVAALNEIESRYLLVLTENLSILSLIFNKFVSASGNSSNYKPPEIIFGSYFKRDIHFTQVCHNINLIKNCMASGTPVILLNLDDLYESLYDTLNQYFSTLGDTRFVGLGLGTHRVKAFIHNDFRLVVIADSQKVYKDFPIPLINRLEKHYISMNSLLNDQQKEVKEDLEKWAQRYQTPNLSYRKQAAMKCWCGTEMYEPYLLPCAHHIGVCCKDKISGGQMPRECPSCRKNGDAERIPNEWEWKVDKTAKESRDYFEKSTLETSFIGYSNEMIALIVIQSTPDDDEFEVTTAQILENAKKQLLQVATADSVLRAEKTTLSMERDWVQRIYFQEQNHENLHSYLNEAISHERNDMESNGESTCLFIQVTTFARLLTSNDMEDIRTKMSGDESSFTKEHCTINDFDTEAEFTDKLRKFYSECHNYQTGLLLLQCESAHTNLELLDSVRYLVFRESKNVQTTRFENHTVVTVLTLNLPRGIPLSCYQGKPWKCVHIDDPSCSNLKTPTLLQCLKMKPSEIIEHVIHDVKTQAGLVQMETQMDAGGDESSSHLVIDLTQEIDVIDLTHVDMDVDMPGTDVADEPEPVVYGTSVSVESIIVPALPKVLSAIDGHDQMSYGIIRDILRSNTDSSNIAQSVVIVWLEYTQSLLKESEQRNTRYNWVTSNAAKAVVMKRNETVRSSLEASLHGEIRPALAAVLAQCEPYNNLMVLLADDSVTKRKFWFELMKACFTTKLNYADIATLDEKLPERFKVSGNLGGRRFNCKFPFSWIVFEIINEMLKQHPPHEAERLFAETAVGLVISKYFEINTRSEGSFKDWGFDRYISDFINLSHPCHSDQEHELVCRSMLAMMKRSTNEDDHFNSFVSIHVLFNRYSEYYSKLSVVINVTLRWNILNKEKIPLWSAVCSEVLLNQENLLRYPCHLLVLMKTMELAQKISMGEFKQDLSGYVSIISSIDGLFKDYILHTNENEEDMTFMLPEFEEAFEKMRTECLITRHQLILKKNYIQHVVLKLNPGVIDPNNIQTDQLSHISRACKGLTEFKKLDSFSKVVKVLENSLIQQTRVVFKCKKDCPRCKKLMISPVRLPCSHLVCLACTESLNWFCPHEDCGIQINEAVYYDPSTDNQLRKKDVKALEIHRTYLNEFFMMFVSDVVFHPEFENSQHKEPSKEVIDYLVGCITSQNGTRKFSIFNAQDVIDQKNPVVRTFLLKLLLHVALREDYDCEYDPEDEDEQTMFVAASKLIEFINKPTDKTYAQLRAQTIALLIDCIKDYLQETDGFGDNSSLDNIIEDISEQFEDADWYKEVKTLSLNHLKETARSHIILEEAMLHILSTEEENPELIDVLKRSLDHLVTVSEQPKLFICRLVNDQFGEGKILDIKHNQKLSFLLPEIIHRALIKFKVDDHLAIEAGTSYKKVVDILDSILTIRAEQLEESVNELNQVTNIQVLLHALFTRVTRFFTTQHPPNENRVNQIRQLLRRNFTQHHDSMWFESILTNKVLRGSLSLESSEGVQISMLALHTFTTLREGHGLLAPLTNILNNVSSCRMFYLPTMPDNPIEEIHATASRVLITRHGENPTPYTCPNGHVYYIGDCGRPYHRGKCGVCGADIGGAGDALSTGNTRIQNYIQQYKTLPGYLEDAAVREPVAERDLNVLSLTVMRCLLHVCLLTASATNREQVNALIGKGEPSISHLITRIKADMKHLSNSLSTNQERVMILLHLTLHRMSHINFGGQYSLADKTSRRTWEATFNDQIIKPLFNQNAVNIAERQQQLISDDVSDMRTIIQPTPVLIQDNMLDCSYMWIYKRPLNLEVIRKTVSSQGDSLVNRFLKQGARLQLVSNLPDIVTLMKRLSVKFDNKFTQEQSESSNIESFLLQHEEFRELVDKYINVWNVYTQLHNDAQTDESAHRLPIRHQSSQLLEILPITVSPDNPNGSTYRRILYYLIETHNSFIHESQRPDDGIDISLVTQSHLVCLPGGSEELVPIVVRHSQYEFGDSFERTCDWDKVSEDIGYQYITGRRPINTESINKLPAYHFPNEFTIITLINKLRDQALVLRSDKETVMQRLSGYGVNQLNGILTQLETMVKICSTIRQYDNTEKLHSAIQRNFDEKPDWLIDSLEVRHLVSLWTVVKFLQAKAFKKNQQLAFDEIVGECKKDLDDRYKVEMKERMASYQSYQTHLLLEHLFEFILFKLNNVTASHEELLFIQPLSDCMDQYILEVYENEEGKNRLRVGYQNGNSPQIPVSQATAAWEFLYILYSTPVETELDQ